jgi:hypothetical protein
MSIKEAEGFGDLEERRLLSCLNSATSLVNNGMDPDYALAKAARDASIHPDSIPLAVQAYNVGRQTYQRDKCAGQGTSCLMSDHPIARVENVESLMFPKQSAILGQRKAASYTGVSSDYALPPAPLAARVKEAKATLAAAELPAVKDAGKRSRDAELYYSACMKAKLASTQVLNTMRISLLNSKDELQTKLAVVRDWCRKNSSQLPLVEFNCHKTLGPGSKEVFDYATVGLTGIKRASFVKEARSQYITKDPVDLTKAPYSLIKAAMDKAVEYIQDEIAVKQASDKIASEVAKAIPFGQHPAESPSQVLLGASSTGKKSAGLFGGVMQGAAGGAISHALTPKSPADITESLSNEISDPAHEAKMRAIKSQAMLTDLLSNDEVISGYDPHEVANSFNELAQLNPHITDQYGVMRSALRKHLTSGQIEPFEIEQLRKVDQSFAPSKGNL